MGARRRYPLLLLGGLALLHLGVQLRWLAADTWTAQRILGDGFAHGGGLLHLLAGLDLGGAPAALRYLRETDSHYPLLAHLPLALAVLSLLASEGFTRPGRAAPFGLASGAAARIKGQALLFICWPAIFVLGRSVLAARRSRDRALGLRVLAGGVLAGCTLLATTAVWWWGRVGRLAPLLQAHVTG